MDDDDVLESLWVSVQNRYYGLRSLAFTLSDISTINTITTVTIFLNAETIAVKLQTSTLFAITINRSTEILRLEEKCDFKKI